MMLYEPPTRSECTKNPAYFEAQSVFRDFSVRRKWRRDNNNVYLRNDQPALNLFSVVKNILDEN